MYLILECINHWIVLIIVMYLILDCVWYWNVFDIGSCVHFLCYFVFVLFRVEGNIDEKLQPSVQNVLRIAEEKHQRRDRKAPRLPHHQQQQSRYGNSLFLFLHATRESHTF